jgi:hypothetical protein
MKSTPRARERSRTQAGVNDRVERHGALVRHGDDTYVRLDGAKR